MKTHADKTQENKTPVASNKSQKLQSSSASTFQFEDNRPEVIAHGKLQEMAYNNPRVQQLKALQKMANNSTQVKKAAQLKGLADNFNASSKQTIKEKENKPGLTDNQKTSIDNNLSGMRLDDMKGQMKGNANICEAAGPEQLADVMRASALQSNTQISKVNKSVTQNKQIYQLKLFTAKPTVNTLGIYQNKAVKIIQVNTQGNVKLTAQQVRIVFIGTKNEQTVPFSQIDDGKSKEAGDPAAAVMTAYKDSLKPPPPPPLPAVLPQHLINEKTTYLGYAAAFDEVEKIQLIAAINEYYEGFLTKQGRLQDKGGEGPEQEVRRKNELRDKIRDKTGLSKGTRDKPEAARSDDDADLIQQVRDILNGELDNIRRTLGNDNITVGFRGSLATGWKNYKKAADDGTPTPFSTATTWDVDGFMVLPNKSGITREDVQRNQDIIRIQGEIHTALSALDGYDGRGHFSFYVRNPASQESLESTGNPYPPGAMARIGRRKSELLRPARFDDDGGRLRAKHAWTVYPETPVKL